MTLRMPLSLALLSVTLSPFAGPMMGGSVAALGQEPPANEQPANAGQADLDEATKLKIAASSGRDLARVIELLDSALEKGLDEGNAEFANEMLASTLLQRATALSGALLNRPLPDPRQNQRWLQVRQLALADLARVVDVDPNNGPAFLLIGRLQLLPLGDEDAARQAFTKVIEFDEVEDNVRAEAYRRRAETLADAEAKLADYNRALELAPNNLEVRLLRARHHFAEEDFDACLADVDAVLEQEPDNAATHELRGLVLLAQDKPKEALQSLNRATELNPDSITPYLRRSELYRRSDDFERAIEQASKAIELADDNVLGYLLRAELYSRSEQPEQALADVEKVLELRPDLVQGLLLKVQVLEQLGRGREALAELETLAEALPNQVEINLQIAAYALTMEMPRRAIAACDRGLQVDQDNLLLRRFRADAQLNIGDHAGAIADYDKALAIDPSDSGVLNNLAWTLATSPTDELRDGQRAIDLATKACELTEYQEAHILSTLAAAYAETGDFETAKKWARDAVALDDPDNTEQIKDELAHYERGEPMRELQQLDSGERNPEEPEFKDPKPVVESTPAPGRTIDF